MKNYQIKEAYQALMTLGRERLPVRTAIAVMTAGSALERIMKSIADVERVIIARYSPKQDGDSLKFESIEDAEACREELTELYDLECDLGGQAMIEIDISGIEDLKITPQDIRALEGIVSFK